MKYQVRSANPEDESKLLKLYKTVARNIGGIAREEHEISPAYISDNLERSFHNGLCLVVEDPSDIENLVAEIHCYKLIPEVFHHVFSELTIVVHPDFQAKGIGKMLFTSLLETIEKDKKDVLRVELIVRESNLKAIEFYKSLGFKIEGRLEKRIKNPSGSFEADIPMAWFNSHFKR